MNGSWLAALLLYIGRAYESWRTRTVAGTP